MEFGIQQSPLSNNIHIGRLSKDRLIFLEKKEVTNSAIMAVINHIKQNIEDEGHNTVNMVGDGVRYELTLEIVKAKKEEEE